MTSKGRQGRKKRIRNEGDIMHYEGDKKQTKERDGRK